MNSLRTRFSLTLIGFAVGTLLVLLGLQQLIAQPQVATLGEGLGTSVAALLASPLREASAASGDQLTTLRAQLDGLELGLQGAFTDRDDYYRAQQRAFWLSTALTVLLAVVFGGFIGRRLAQPVEQVAATAEQVAHGDLSARVPLRSGSSAAIFRLTRSFNTMTETLQRLEEERKATLNDVAHDLKNPLTVIQGRLDAFADGVTPLTLAKVAALQRPVDMLANLIGDLRTLALAEAGHLSLVKAPVNLTELARKVVQDFAEKAHRKDIDLGLRAAEQAVYLEADDARLERILYNLVDNAIKYTPRGGHVYLYLLEQGDDVQLVVRDSGAGLSGEDLKKVMNRFYRVNSEEGVSELGSSGIGLAIVNALTTLHGGRVEVGNAETGGAEFMVVLPRLADPTMRPALLS